jgi:hypothetical protein
VDDVIDLAGRYQTPVLCGAFTATEVFNAMRRGVTAVKIFPARWAAQVYDQSEDGLPEVNLIPSGGINENNAAEFIRCGACAVSGARTFMNFEMIQQVGVGCIYQTGRQIRGDRTRSEEGPAGYPVTRAERRNAEWNCAGFLPHEPDRAAAPGDTGTETDRVHVHPRDGRQRHVFCRCTTTRAAPGYVRPRFWDGGSICDFTPQDLVYTREAVIRLEGLRTTRRDGGHLKPFWRRAPTPRRFLCASAWKAGGDPNGALFRPLAPAFARKARNTSIPDARLRMIGVDVPSIACIAHLDETMSAHHAFFSPPRKRTPVHHRRGDEAFRKVDGIARMTVSPWLFEGMNSGPCVIWAEYDS